MLKQQMGLLDLADEVRQLKAVIKEKDRKIEELERRVEDLEQCTRMEDGKGKTHQVVNNCYFSSKSLNSSMMKTSLWTVKI